MRWKPIDTRTPPKIIEWFFIVVSAPLWAPLVTGAWLYHQYRKRVPPPSAHWHPWFAWRPVRAWTDDGDAAVWLETIERRRFFSTLDYRIPEAMERRRAA
jgi:hypothetical protein